MLTKEIQGLKAHLGYFPMVQHEAELIDVVSRAAWFLTFSLIEKISVPVADPRLADEEWRVAPGIDPAIAIRFDVLRRLIEFIPDAGERDLALAIRDASVVLRWKANVAPDFVRPAVSKDWLPSKRVWQVDTAAIRMGGFVYMKFVWT